MDGKCKNCGGIGLVCENHPTKAWADLLGPHVCPVETETTCCCGAGAPCACNPLSKRSAPRKP